MFLVEQFFLFVETLAKEIFRLKSFTSGLEEIIFYPPKLYLAVAKDGK